jgi:hypothetical protein
MLLSSVGSYQIAETSLHLRLGSEHGQQIAGLRFTADCGKVGHGKALIASGVDFDPYATNDAVDDGRRQLTSFPVWPVQHAAFSPVFIICCACAASVIGCILVRGPVYGEFAVVAAASQLAAGLVQVPRPLTPRQPDVLNIIHSLCTFTAVTGPDSFQHAYT